MSNEYIMVLRSSENNITGAISHNGGAYLQELSVLHSFLLNNLRFGAVRAEVHSLLPEEGLSQAIERIKQDQLRPLTAITKDDLSEQEIEGQA